MFVERVCVCLRWSRFACVHSDSSWAGMVQAWDGNLSISMACSGGGFKEVLFFTREASFAREAFFAREHGTFHVGAIAGRFQFQS